MKFQITVHTGTEAATIPFYFFVLLGSQMFFEIVHNAIYIYLPKKAYHS